MAWGCLLQATAAWSWPGMLKSWGYLRRARHLGADVHARHAAAQGARARRSPLGAGGVPPAAKLDGLDDLLVAGAAAQVAADARLDLVPAGVGVLVQQRLGRHDHAGGAVAALGGGLLDEGLLDGVELVVVAQALDGVHPAALGLERRVDAGGHRLAVHQDGAGAALALAAADLGADEAQPVAQHVGQHLAGARRRRRSLCC